MTRWKGKDIEEMSAEELRAIVHELVAAFEFTHKSQMRQIQMLRGLNLFSRSNMPWS